MSLAMPFVTPLIPVDVDSVQAPETRSEGLRIEGLNVTFATRTTSVHAVKNLSLAIEPGECLGVVGESGAGKSQAFLAALGLLAANGRASGSIRFQGRELLGMETRELDRIRGARIGTVFQDPMTSLTPHIRVGDQIAEPLVCHRGLGWRDARSRALQLLSIRLHFVQIQRRLSTPPGKAGGSTWPITRGDLQTCHLTL